MMKLSSRSVFSRSILVVSSVALMACEGQKSSGGGSLGGTCELSGRVSTDYDGPAVAGYCSGSTSYSGGVTISGSATFQAREIDWSLSSPTIGLGAAGSPKPIRHAEYVVTNSSGTQVNCGETDASGDFSFQLPNDGGTYSIAVRSRANNSNLKAYVMNCPEENGVYTIGGSFTADSTKNIGTYNASVSGDILGGAFNILDQVLEANDYLRSVVGTCSFTGCQAFSVAPLATIYWDAGFNPGHYSGSGGTSFFTPSSNRLFILGGIDGDTNNSDTDHFDNSVILHEYGHFLESNVMATSSPGGAHGLDRLLDPRLAWSEGFSNFFQAAVTGVPRYIDTQGNVDGSTTEFFRIDLEDQSGSYVDRPRNAEEGNFREFSVTRVLWDSIDTVNDGETITGGFPEIWAAVTNTTNGGFKYTNSKFHSLGLFHDFQDNMSGRTDWSSIRSIAMQSADRSNYAYYVDNTGVCLSNNFSITPSSQSNLDFQSDNGTLTTSHALLNNDFYHYIHGGGNLVLTLNYTTQSGSEADLDLHLYLGDGVTTNNRMLVSQDIFDYGSQGMDSPDNSIGTSEIETVTATNLAAGHYIIAVNVFTGSPPIGGPTDYEILVGGVRLCPTTLP